MNEGHKIERTSAISSSTFKQTYFHSLNMSLRKSKTEIKPGTIHQSIAPL